MLDLESITLRNYMSWGDYETTLKLSNMGECFITGIISKPDGKNGSNGAGKTALTQSILWTLCGETLYSSRSANKVLNWFTSGDCVCTIKLKSGKQVTRILRRKNNKTELLYTDGNREIINSTLSTTTNQQEHLNKLLGIQFDILSGSIFFSQYRRPWLEMSDQARKELLEQIMDIDKISMYSDVSKERRDKAVIEQETTKAEISHIRASIKLLQEQLDNIISASDNAEKQKKSRYEAKIAEITKLKIRLDKIKTINIDDIKKIWSIIEGAITKANTISKAISNIHNELLIIGSKRTIEIEQRQSKYREESNSITNKINEIQNYLYKLISEASSDKNVKIESLNQEKSEKSIRLSVIKSNIQTLKQKINAWKDKAGKICIECEQEISEQYISKSKIEPLYADLEANERELEILVANIETISITINECITNYNEFCASKRNEVDRLIKNYESEVGNIEAKCMREVEDTNNLFNDKERLLIDRRKKLQADLDKLNDLIDNNKPDLSVKEAEAVMKEAGVIEETIALLQAEAENILAETNDFDHTITRLQSEIDKCNSDIEKLVSRVEAYDAIISHLTYIYRSYSDRKKIKSLPISKHRPFFNARIQHYLEQFDLDIHVGLTDSLSLTSNLWGYDMQSNGERCRTELAFMFAVYDLHEAIHGPQCNILVLDEPERGLDDVGKESLINIIKNDLSNRFESIFIISHDSRFFDIFPHQLTIVREDRLSYLAESR